MVSVAVNGTTETTATTKGARKAATKDAPTPALSISIPELKIEVFQVRLVGDSPLIVHKWSNKAKEMMLAKQMKQAKAAKEAKDPKRDYEESLYVIGEREGKPVYGFPVIGFKAAAVSACSHIDGVTKVVARGAFHVVGEHAEIIGTPRPREDMVRIAMGTADIRYRGEFPKWETTLTVRYNPNVLSASQIVNLFNVAGFAIGVGEWRPEKDGQYGMFHVENA